MGDAEELCRLRRWTDATRALGPTRLDREPFADKVRDVLAALGEDPAREGLLKTPERVEASLRFLTQGYHMSVAEVIGDAVFAETHQSMIMVRDIELYSLCEHHLLPFFGRAHVAYIPNGKILGLSKVARIVDVFARRLQVQERLTDQIADAVMDVLAPTGVGVVIEAAHFCMMMRGVREAELAHGHQRASRHLPRRLQDAGRVPPARARRASSE